MGDYTEFISVKMDEWANVIYDIEDQLVELKDNIPALMEYLKDLRYSMPLGLALRRYFCNHFGRKTPQGTVLVFPDGAETPVKGLMSEGYDILTDDLKTYADLFIAVNRGRNQDALEKAFPRPEVNRMLRQTGTCTRSKLILISFALHMQAEDVHWFFTSVLMEQTYNMRDPDEVIAYFCQSHEVYNSYKEYQRLCDRFALEASDSLANGPQTSEYTRLARTQMAFDVQSEDDLMRFLADNQINFAGYSQTAYEEYKRLVEKAMACTEVQRFSSDEYLNSETIKDTKQRAKQEERINRSIEIHPAENTEQLAREMLSFIPRATKKYERDGRQIVEADFIPIYNGERGQKSKKVQTTLLPKEITMNLLMRDRLDDLLARRKPVERKDLVFLRFYVFCMKLQKKDTYSSSDYLDFLDECNSMLTRCGMAKLYPANRFENLILLALVSSNPFEMFESIIEASFINETGIAKEDDALL